MAGLFAFFVFLTLGTLAFDAKADANRDNVRKVQQSLSNKGFYHGEIDGLLGPRTRKAIGDYQKSENRPVTGQLDAETSGQLGVAPQTVGDDFKGAGKDVAAGSKTAGHDVSNGKPVAAGKDFGKGVGRAGKKVAKGVKAAVTP
jgi:peptidoglycan hydrolase-like protein with peptidoglycan-binding domain